LELPHIYKWGIGTSHRIQEWSFGERNRKKRLAAGRPVETRSPLKVRMQQEYWKEH